MRTVWLREIRSYEKTFTQKKNTNTQNREDKHATKTVTRKKERKAKRQAKNQRLTATASRGRATARAGWASSHPGLRAGGAAGGKLSLRNQVLQRDGFSPLIAAWLGCDSSCV